MWFSLRKTDKDHCIFVNGAGIGIGHREQIKCEPPGMGMSMSMGMMGHCAGIANMLRIHRIDAIIFSFNRTNGMRNGGRHLECKCMFKILGWIRKWSKALAIIRIVDVGGVVVAIVEYIKSKLYSVTLYSHAWSGETTQVACIRIDGSVESSFATYLSSLGIQIGAHHQASGKWVTNYDRRYKSQIYWNLPSYDNFGIVFEPFTNAVWRCSGVLRIIRKSNWMDICFSRGGIGVIYVTCWKETLIIKWAMPVGWS